MSADRVGGRVEVAGIVLARIRDHGPWVDHQCHWCNVDEDLVKQGLTEHWELCLWLEVVAATDRPGDDLGHPGGGGPCRAVDPESGLRCMADRAGHWERHWHDTTPDAENLSGHVYWGEEG